MAFSLRGFELVSERKLRDGQRRLHGVLDVMIACPPLFGRPGYSVQMLFGDDIDSSLYCCMSTRGSHVKHEDNTQMFLFLVGQPVSLWGLAERRSLGVSIVNPEMGIRCVVLSYHKMPM